MHALDELGHRAAERRVAADAADAPTLDVRPLRAALLGNITYEIVPRAPHPVLVVPNDD